MTTPHIPVLLTETLAALAIQSGDLYVDATLGAGWATRYSVSVRAVGEALSENAVTVGNAGPSTARDVVVTDRWPAQFTQFLQSLTSSRGRAR